MQHDNHHHHVHGMHPSSACSAPRRKRHGDHAAMPAACIVSLKRRYQAAMHGKTPNPGLLVHPLYILVALPPAMDMANHTQAITELRCRTPKVHRCLSCAH